MPHPSPTGTLPADASGAVLLAVAVVRQAWLDRDSPSAAIRGEAQRWWENPDAVRPWADVLDLDVEALTAAVVRLGPRAPGPH
jgi:hypothetical protein